MPTENTTKLRLPKKTKERLNRIASQAGFSAELLGDLLLSESLDQIEADLTPTDLLTHVTVLRRRLGKRVTESHMEAVLDRLLAARGEPLLSDRINEMMEEEKKKPAKRA